MISTSDFEKICMKGDIGVVNSTVRDIEIRNAYGSNARYWNWGLYGACVSGHLDIAHLMIKKGATNLNQGLCGACGEGYMEIVKLMIKYGANNWNLGLGAACFDGHLNIINLMLEKGADPNNGLTSACVRGHLNIVKLMIDKGANCLNFGLEDACKNGNMDVVKLLIEHGANNWDLGLDGACEGEHLEIAELMIEHGANKFNNRLCLLFDTINSDIVNLVIRKNIPLKFYLGYPGNKTKIFKLHEFGLSVDYFKDISGFDDLIKDMEERQSAVKHTLDNYFN